MTKKLLLTPFVFACALHADSSTDSNTMIPEGKIIDYPSIYHDVTPSAGPRVIDGVGLFVTGDYLYWTARQDNMQYAVSGFTTDNSVSTQGGSVHQLNYRFRTGFKAGLGYSFSHDMWDSLFNYTWFQSNHNSGSTTATLGQGLIPSFVPYVAFEPGSSFSSASAVWRLHFNVIDWEIGRNFYISKFLSLRPFIGLKGTWQNQHNNSAYSGVNEIDTFDYTRKMSSSFMGIGIRTGCNMGWHLAGTWSLYGDVAFSNLWGQFKATRHDQVTYPDIVIDPVSNRSQSHTAAPVLELGIGIRKDQWFWHNRLHIAVQAGWEEQIWWDQNQFIGNYGIATGGNLVLQGLTVRLRFDF